jgi:hypothetical protein
MLLFVLTITSSRLYKGMFLALLRNFCSEGEEIFAAHGLHSGTYV